MEGLCEESLPPFGISDSSKMALPPALATMPSTRRRVDAGEAWRGGQIDAMIDRAPAGVVEGASLGP
jgi:hypothetical protein